MEYIYHKLGNDGLFECARPHTLAFEIGGKLFPVDPRDFVSQAFADNVDGCISTVVPTDPPRLGGYLYSWSLGVPFLKRSVGLVCTRSPHGRRLDGPFLFFQRCGVFLLWKHHVSVAERAEDGVSLDGTEQCW